MITAHFDEIIVVFLSKIPSIVVKIFMHTRYSIANAHLRLNV